MRPSIGHWYLATHSRELFQVTAVDERAGTIEIQTFDGNLDEIPVGRWKRMRLQRAAPPADWNAPIDTPEADDAFFESLAIDGNVPTGYLERREPWEDPRGEEEIDRYTERMDPPDLL